MTKAEYAEMFQVAIESVYWCVVCECWTEDQEDGYPGCLCA